MFSEYSTTIGLVVVALLILALVVLNQRKKTIISNTSKALEETEARYRLLFEHSPVALLEEDLGKVKTFLDQLIASGVTDLDRYLAEHPETLSRCATMVRIVDANRAALSLYGADTAATLGHLATVLPDDQSILFRKELLGLLKEGGSEIIIANRTLAGTVLTVERRAVVAAGFEQSWRKVFVNVLDLTEQIRLRQQNKTFEKQLQQTQKLEAIGSLAGGIAHDFNNILTPIQGRAELMLLELTGNESLRGHCRGIVDAAKRARSLVKQILTFSRQVDQDIAPVSLAAIAEEVVDLIRPTLPATMTIECELAEYNHRVMADATQLHQVIMNLVTNGLHAMEDRGGVMRLRLATITVGPDEGNRLSIPHGRYQHLCIEDGGHGMDQITLARIFDPYFSTKPRGKGTGLGLAVVLGILRGYGGEIRVQSEVGKGTAFDLYFPAVELATEQQPVEQFESETLPRGSEHILLVDDEKSIADVTAGMLERLGYTVTLRISGYDALEAFRNLADRVDLLITDLTMPQMTGLQIYREIKKIRPEIKVIICTGFSEHLDDRSAQAIGIEGFLYKPVVLSDLARCVRTVLDGPPASAKTTTTAL